MKYPPSVGVETEKSGLATFTAFPLLHQENTTHSLSTFYPLPYLLLQHWQNAFCMLMQKHRDLKMNCIPDISIEYSSKEIILKCLALYLLSTLLFLP